MDRRTALAAHALALSGMVHAQGARRPLLGYLVLQPIVEPPSPERKAFLDGLRALGLTLPQPLLLRADEVIQ